MKLVRLSALGRGRLYPQKTFQVLISVRVGVDLRAILRPERLCQWRIPITPSGFEPATFRLVEQCLNKLCYRVPHVIVLELTYFQTPILAISIVMSVCPSVSFCVRMKQIFCHWTSFHEICFNSLPRNAKKIQQLLKSDKNNRHFTWGRYIYIYIYIYIYDKVPLN
jgi:hypothetical protein